jgi:uncharacterized protein YndB with AHSA1/START domain
MTDTERTIEQELLIAADPDAVWKALTEGDEIMRWFAIDARSDPRPGGVVQLRWNENNAYEDCEIVEWDPQSRLTLTWRTSIDPDRNLPLEFRLQRTDGGTLLRMVHSGFLTDASWDDEFDSHARGWNYELRSLKYYLEHYLGHTRQILKRRFPVADREAAWQALVGPQGLFRVDGSLREGAPVTFTLPSGARASAEIFVALAGTDLALIVDALDGGIFRFSFEVFTGQPEVYLWAMSWQLAQNQLEKLMTPCVDAVQAALEGRRQAS